MGSMVNEEEKPVSLDEILRRATIMHNRVVSNYVMIEADLRKELTVERSFKGELRQTIHDLETEAHAMGVHQGSLNKLIHQMRNCDNCNEHGCHERLDNKVFVNCVNNDLKLWEHGQ